MHWQRAVHPSQRTTAWKLSIKACILRCSISLLCSLCFCAYEKWDRMDSRLRFFEGKKGWREEEGEILTIVYCGRSSATADGSYF